MMKKGNLKKKSRNYSRMVALACAMCLGFTGCGEVEEEEDSIVVVEHGKEESLYTLAVVAVNNVVKTEKVRCTYRQVNDEELSFQVSGKKVENLFVAKGDAVKKGQLLVELTGCDRDDEVEQLEYQIKRNELLLSYLDINKEYDLSGRWWQFVFKSSGSESEYERLQSDVDNIEKEYRYDREDLEDAIRLDKMELEAIKKSMEEGRVYAGMDGEISYINSKLTTDTSVAGEVIMKIIDSSVCLFETTKTEYAPYFQENVSVVMTVGSGKNAVTVEAIPYEMENWETNGKLTFELVGGGESANVTVGTSAVITLEISRKEHVLCIPSQAVHEADGKSYVYVLGENDIREVKWIETGLYGDSLVEVVNGLTEGENIILK